MAGRPGSPACKPGGLHCRRRNTDPCRRHPHPAASPPAPFRQPLVLRHLPCTPRGRRVESRLDRDGQAGWLPNPTWSGRTLSVVSRKQWRWAMVLQQHARWFPDASFPRLDAGRIAAGAGAIALNVAALLLLLMPAGMPKIATPASQGIVVIPIIER